MKSNYYLYCSSCLLFDGQRDKIFVQPGEILDLSENAFERHGIKVSEIDSVSMSGSFTFSIKVRSHARELGEKP